MNGTLCGAAQQRADAKTPPLSVLFGGQNKSGIGYLRQLTAWFSLARQMQGRNMKLFVGNLPFTLSEQQMQDHFAAYGQVSSARIISDRETGRSRGFGFVEMPDDAQARAAITALDGQPLNGRQIRVSEAKPQEDGGRGPRRGPGPR